jgi:hypothetical protein
MGRHYTRHSLRKNTTPGNRASRRTGCGRYGGLGLNNTGRFKGAGPNTSASRGPMGTGSGIGRMKNYLMAPRGGQAPFSKACATCRRSCRRVARDRFTHAQVATGRWHSCQSLYGALTKPTKKHSQVGKGGSLKKVRLNRSIDSAPEQASIPEGCSNAKGILEARDGKFPGLQGLRPPPVP